ncbi:MAG TPA: SMP-30/gluconolactonase/LRE family protein [Planctomycetota bacterium]|nr:SMP-30/gluconolactonase/LRE family protein [Planctomycetota bacterium]
MKTMRACSVFAILLLLVNFTLLAGEDLKHGPDSEEQPNVPKGVLSEHKFTESKIFPGTSRSYWIYLPPNFNAEAEYPLMIFCDGGGVVKPKGDFRAPVVFDNLIAKKEIPPLVGLFINPGEVPGVQPGSPGRSTRSFEYDTPDDTCARFFIEEMIPLAAKHAKISAKPEDRAVVGISSGGICAFNAAWHRPDAFRKVISGIGSFTNIRGGVWFPAAIRKTERKPIRVWMQEGSNDLDNVHGNWVFGNNDVAAALKFAGYDYKYVLTDGGHGGKHPGILFPDALRWLWRKDDALPAPTPEVPNDLALSGLLIPGENWTLVVEGKKFVDAACSDAEGNFYFSDMNGDGLFKVALDGTISLFNGEAKGVSGMKFGPDGRLYACVNRAKQIVAYDKDGKAEILASDVGCNDLVVNSKGHIYFTETGKKQVVLCEGPGKLRVVDTGIQAPNGITLAPNQETLAVSDAAGSAVWAFRVETDGNLSAKMPVMPYRQFGRFPEAKGDGMTCDTRGRWYVSTATGIQVFDPNGRPVGLILAPTEAPVTTIALSGPDLSYLFALTQGKIFKRKVNAKGFLASLPPFQKEEGKKK